MAAQLTSPREVVHRLVAALNAGDFDTAESLIDTHAVNHAAPGNPVGVAAFRQSWDDLRSAFPDWHFTIEHSVEAGDTVASRYTNRGTQQGVFMGKPATGRRITVFGLDMVRVRDGRVVEHWALIDQAALAAQLGSP
jgi:predicted ester cyclase